MKTTYLSATRLVAASIILGAILFIALVAYAPDAAPFSTNNYGWNGIEQVASQYSLHPIPSLVDLPSEIQNVSHSVLLIVGPVSNFSATQASSVLNFVRVGGTLVVADSTGSSNSLLESLGAGIEIEAGYAVYDNLYNWKAPSLPTALVLPQASGAFQSTFAQVSGIALNEPSPLALSGSSPALPAAETSPNSFESNRSSISLLNGEPSAIAQGPFVVSAIEKIGTGKMFVVGDSEFLTNPIVGIADNPALVSNLFSNSTVYLDTSHWPLDTSASLKAELFQVYSIMSGPALRYIFTLVITGAVIGIMPVFGLFKKRSDEGESKSAAQRDIVPDKDPKILERIRRDRRF